MVIHLYDVSGSYQPPALPRDLRDHDGDTVPLVSTPVSRLTLPATVGDGVTVDAGEKHLLTLLLRSLLTHGAGSTIFQGLGVKLGHLYLLLKQFVELLLLILILVCQFRLVIIELTD